jgi:hypothetical protein
MTRAFVFAFLISVYLMPVDAGGGDRLVLQILSVPSNGVLFEFTVNTGDHFYLDYVHSSDHTPIHDVFEVGQGGEIILIEEDYKWYGAGLEFHPQADITFREEGTRVRLHRIFPNFLLRVGRIANHRVSYKDTVIQLIDLAAGGSLVRIRIIQQ